MEYYIIFLTFTALIAMGFYANDVMTWYYIIGTIISVVSILIGVWRIINHAFEKRDKEIKQLLLSEQEFKDHKDTTNTMLMNFSKRVDKVEYDSDHKFNKIMDKLDHINDTINDHNITLSKLETKVDNIEKKLDK